jgi:hypothetical protein
MIDLTGGHRVSEILVDGNLRFPGKFYGRSSLFSLSTPTFFETCRDGVADYLFDLSLSENVYRGGQRTFLPCPERCHSSVRTSVFHGPRRERCRRRRDVQDAVVVDLYQVDVLFRCETNRDLQQDCRELFANEQEPKAWTGT